MSSDLLPSNNAKLPPASLSLYCERVKKTGSTGPPVIRDYSTHRRRNQTGPDKPITAAISPAGDTPAGVMRARRGGWKIYLRCPVSCCRHEEPSCKQKKIIIEFGTRERIDMHEVRYGIACSQISIRQRSFGR